MAIETEELEDRTSSSSLTRDVGLSSESDLFSAIHNSIALGEEANRREQEQELEHHHEEEEEHKKKKAAALETAVRLSQETTASSSTNHVNGHSTTINVHNGVHNINGGGDSLFNRDHHASPDQLSLPGEEIIIATSSHIVTATATTTTVEQSDKRSSSPVRTHRASDGFRYTPVRDLSGPDGSSSNNVINQAVTDTTQMQMQVERSPSVSYVDPLTNLNEDQDRDNLDAMIKYYAQSHQEQQQQEQQRPRSRSSLVPPIPANNSQSATWQPVEQEAKQERQSTPRVALDASSMTNTSSRHNNGGLHSLAQSPAFDGGWGLSASQQHTPAPTTASYEEFDELEEASRQSHRSNEPSSSRNIFSLASSASPARPVGTSTYSPSTNLATSLSASSPSRVDKGKGRAVEPDEVVDSTIKPSSRNSDKGENIVDRQDSEQFTHPSPTREQKGKQRARTPTPTPPPAASSSFPRYSSQDMTNTTSPGARPAHVGRKYRGMERLKRGACAALLREETFLDFHTETAEDGKTTCWIRCINWDSDDGEDTDGSDEDTVRVTVDRKQSSATCSPGASEESTPMTSRARGRASGRGRGRGPGRGRTNSASAAANSTKSHKKGVPRIASCAAEVLADLIDGETDKWRVAGMNDEHSAACNSLIKQLAAGEDLVLPDYLRNLGDEDYDAQLAAAIQASQQTVVADDDDSELARALHFSQFDSGGNAQQDTDMDIGYPSPEPQGSGSNSNSAQATPRSAGFQFSRPDHERIVEEKEEELQPFMDIDAAPRATSTSTSRDGDDDDDALARLPEEAEFSEVAAPASTPSRQPAHSDVLHSDSSGMQDQTAETGAALGQEAPPRQPSPPQAPASQGFLQRIYNSFAPSRVAPQRRCVTGDSFSTSNDFLDGAAKALSLSMDNLFIRNGDMYGTAYKTVMCSRHHDLTAQERAATGLPVKGSYDCEAIVKGFQQNTGGAWRVGNILYRHSPACEQQRTSLTPTQTSEVNTAPQGIPSEPENAPHSAAMSSNPSTDSNMSGADNIGDSSSTPAIIRRLMPFENLASLKNAALEALDRTLSEVETKEEVHPVYPAQQICNIYCKNYSFGQPQTSRTGWALFKSRAGLGAGQSAPCMAFVASSKKAASEPWVIGHFKLEHGPRCQLDHDEARKVDSNVNMAGLPDTATTLDSQIESPRQRSPLGSFDAPPLGDDGPDRPVVERASDTLDSASDDVQDSDIEFVGEVDGPPPPMIKNGDRYPTRHSFKEAVQKLSHFLNKGSKVVWSAKKENKPTKVVCRNGPGYYQDRSSGVLCNFRIDSHTGNGRRVIVSRVYAEHSPECMVSHGNSTTRTSAGRPASAMTNPAPASRARKTAKSAPVARIRRVGLAKRPSNEGLSAQSHEGQSSDTDDGQPQNASTARRKLAAPSHSSHDRDTGPEHAESSRAAQRRTHDVSSLLHDKLEGSPRSTSTYRKERKPARPRSDAIYNSVHHFIAAVDAFSSWRSPAAELKRQNGMNNKKKGGYMVIYCGSDGCPFRVSGRNLRDDRGRELEGFQIKDAVTHHNSDCRAREANVKPTSRLFNSKSVSAVELESSANLEEGPSFTNIEQQNRSSIKRPLDEPAASKSDKKRRVVIDSEDDVSDTLPPPLSVQHEAQAADHQPALDAVPDAPSSNASARDITPVIQSHSNDFDDDIREFLAQNQPRIKEEPSSPERPSTQARIFTGKFFNSRDEFVDTVLRHTEERNPGCQLSVANTDPARVRVYCRRPDCQYSFNSVYEHGSRQTPAVKVTANHREHSTSCIAYYRSLRQGEQRVHFDPPILDQEIGDWHDFESAVQAHTDSVNPGCELKTTNRENNCRVYCPHLDLGCRYTFTARFDIPELQEGRVTVSKVQSEHSQGCIEHHRRIAQEEAEEEAALNPGRARKSLNPDNTNAPFRAFQSAQAAPSRRGPGPHVGDDFEDEESFKEAVERHSQSVNPGSLLGFRRPTINNCQMQCKLWHTGCRYEFYAALHPPAADGSRRVVITDITPEHHEMCVAELVLRGRRTAPDDGNGPRTCRSRASLPSSLSQNPHAQISPARPKAETSKARKSTHKRRSLGNLLDDSDSESGRLSLRESNLMNHTSMNVARDAVMSQATTSRIGRPPLIPPSQYVSGRPPLIPEPARPVKRTRFIEESDTSQSSQASNREPEDSPPIGEAVAGLETSDVNAPSESTAATTAPTAAGDVSLRDIMDPSEADRLEQAGYQLVSNLVRIGVQREDWPDLHIFLSSPHNPRPDVTTTTREIAEERNSLDPIEVFLLTRRARLAFIEEAEGAYRP